MNKKNVRYGAMIAMVLALTGTAALAQRPKVIQKTPKPIIFAVLNDGRTLEPIALVNKNKLEAPVNGSDDIKKITAFDKTYYKPKTIYRLIFGSANAGSVTVKSADPKAECSQNMAEATTLAPKVTLKGLVMGLATNVPARTETVAYRRKPTAAEKNEIDALVKGEFLKQKLTARELHYQNLTAIDVDNDSRPELVGSYWIEIDKLTRALLFFIAQKGAKSGKYSLGYKEYRTIDQASVMSGEIKSVDEGVYHELLLDSFDYDGNGTAEVFTYTQSFEGAGFNAYRKSGGKWVKAFEFGNYHCGY
jgi:hypothetical protein